MMIHRTFSKINTKELGSATFIASTDGADRYNDIVDQKSWLLESYRENAVILLNHRQDMLPIGKATRVEVIEGNLEIDVKFDMEDELGKEVARKVDGGFLSAVSVGFQPKKAINRSELPPEHPAYSKSAGQFFQENELLEISVVTIPANAAAVAKGLNMQDMQTKKMLHAMIKEQILAMPIDTLVTLKHILKIEETAESFIVTYAKTSSEEELEMDDMEEEIEESMKEEEDSENLEKYHSDENEEDGDKTKSLLTYLLTL